MRGREKEREAQEREGRRESEHSGHGRRRGGGPSGLPLRHSHTIHTEHTSSNACTSAFIALRERESCYRSTVLTIPNERDE